MIVAREHLCLLVLLIFSNYASAQEASVSVDPSETEELEVESDELPEPPKYEIPQGVQTLSFNPANLTDEDQHSQHLPRDLKCDGCRVVAFVMREKLKKIQNRYKKGHKLSESDIVDLFDIICRDPEESFNGYGVKEIMGVRRLSGEGLETKDVPGVMSGGGRWPARLKEICFEYIGEVGEDLIYNAFLQKRSLENFLCRDKMGQICPSRTNSKDKSKTTKETEKNEQNDKPSDKQNKEKKEISKGKAKDKKSQGKANMDKISKNKAEKDKQSKIKKQNDKKDGKQKHQRDADKEQKQKGHKHEKQKNKKKDKGTDYTQSKEDEQSYNQEKEKMKDEL